MARNNNEATFKEGEAASLDIFSPVYGGLPNLEEFEILNSDASTDDTIGVYAQDLLSIGKKVKLLVGGRFDWNFREKEDLVTGETFEEDPVSSF